VGLLVILTPILLLSGNLVLQGDIKMLMIVIIRSAKHVLPNAELAGIVLTPSATRVKEFTTYSPTVQFVLNGARMGIMHLKMLVTFVMIIADYVRHQVDL